MGYNIKQKIEICLKAEANPQMTQSDLASWAMVNYGGVKKPSQTTILRILSSKNELISLKLTDFKLVRRRKQQNPLLRRILTEWITQALWENIPITTPIIQLTSNAIWNRLPTHEKEGNGVFNQKWCTHFSKKLNVNLKGDPSDLDYNPEHYPLNKVWQLDEKLDLKSYLNQIILKEGYRPQDVFTIDEFQLFHNLPLDQIFDVLSIDKGLKQSSSSTENLLTIMLGTNIDGLEKLTPLVVGKHENIDILKLLHPLLKSLNLHGVQLMNRITEIYNIYYKLNGNKWITLLMFQNYLLTLEHKIASTDPERKILILLDDLSSHRIINLKFSNIRLCYLHGNLNIKNNLYLSQAGVKLDYLPMSFGIVEEFKILYRIQQYLEMINAQNNLKDRGGQAATLTEREYDVPLIRVFEWIKRLWDLITNERVILLWKRTHLFQLHPWPSPTTNAENLSYPNIQILLALAAKYNVNKSYEKLQEIMQYLNVVIPWKIDELLTLVNERGKVTLNYVSIEEIIGSCLLDSEKEPKKITEWLDGAEKDDYFNSAMTINSLLTDGMNTLQPLTPSVESQILMNPNSTNGNEVNSVSVSQTPGLNGLGNILSPVPGNILSTVTGSLPEVIMEMSDTRNSGNGYTTASNNGDMALTATQQNLSLSGYDKRVTSYNDETYSKDADLIKSLSKVIEAQELNLSSSTMMELQSRLAVIQKKYN